MFFILHRKMKLHCKAFIFFGISLLLFNQNIYATHIVGGDFTVKWVSGNDFMVTLEFFRDCGPNSIAGFDEDVEIGIYNKATNQPLSPNPIIVLDTNNISQVKLGDACYDPKMCLERAVYSAIVRIPNNPSGYYLAYQRCCRNGVINNIVTPLDAGYVMYCEIPDPALKNSSPTFNTIPDGYMCHTYKNADDFSCTDIDGDSLVYSFSTPYNCAASTPGKCGDGPTPKPYGTITWQSPYSLPNPMGDVNMMVDAKGIVTTTPPTIGVFVFCVKVEEYRKGIKIGEVRRDFQFTTLPCHILSVNNKVPSFCLGGATTLTAQGVDPSKVFTYSWSPGGQTTSSIIAAITSSGTYHYSVTATSGSCISKSVTTIKVNPTPIQSTIAANNVLCFGGEVTATVNPVGGVSPYTFEWINMLQTSATVTGLAAGTYSVTVTDSNGCSATIATTISQPLAALAASSKVSGFSCGGQSPNGMINTLVLGGTKPYSYSWLPGNQTDSLLHNVAAGMYSVTITDANGCSISSLSTLPPSIKPKALFSYTSVLSCEGLVLNLKDESTSSSIITDWKWDFGDGFTASSQNPFHVYQYGSGNHVLQLIVYSKPCYDTLQINIKSDDIFNYVSFDERTNVFTPNGDKVNDCFIPSLGTKSAEDFKKCASLVVYDRWGIKMFESIGADNCWDGTNMQNNKPATDGMYYYAAKLDKKIIRGSVSLLRR
jgi:gliding motility-associated-like protein